MIGVAKDAKSGIGWGGTQSFFVNEIAEMVGLEKGSGFYAEGGQTTGFSQGAGCVQQNTLRADDRQIRSASGGGHVVVDRRMAEKACPSPVFATAEILIRISTP